MEKGPIGTRRMENGPSEDFYDELQASWRVIVGPTGTRRMEKVPSKDFYDELHASQMSNCRSHRYTSDGEGSHWYT